MSKSSEGLRIDQELLDAMVVLGWRQARNDFPWQDIRVDDPDIIPDPISFDRVLEGIEKGNLESAQENIVEFDPGFGEDFERMAARNRGDPISEDVRRVMREDRERAIEDKGESADE